MEDAMSDVEQQGKDGAEKAKSGSSRLVSMLVPLTAALTSAAVTYGIKKVPRLVEQHVKPTLKQAPDLASDVMQRARDVGSSSSSSSSGGSKAGRERERTQRAARRRQR